MMRTWALGMALLGATGCGCITGQVHIDRAQRAVEQAAVDDGAHKAPYLFNSATQHLQEARIAYGYSRFAEAADLADKAQASAHEAQMAPAVKPGACLGGP